MPRSHDILCKSKQPLFYIVNPKCFTLWGEQIAIFVSQWWYLSDFFLFWPITLHLLVFVSFIWCRYCLLGVGRHLLKHFHACQVTVNASKWPHLSCTCIGKETFAGEHPRAVFVQLLHVCMWAFQSSLREVHCVWTRVAEHFGLIKDKLHRRMSACEGELTPEGACELIGKWINHFTVVLNFIQCNIAYLNRYCSFTDTITPSKS